MRFKGNSEKHPKTPELLGQKLTQPANISVYHPVISGDYRVKFHQQLNPSKRIDLPRFR